MLINFKTRALARSFAQKRNANGYPAQVVDHGKESVKRYSVNLHPKG